MFYVVMPGLEDELDCLWLCVGVGGGVGLDLGNAWEQELLSVKEEGESVLKPPSTPRISCMWVLISVKTIRAVLNARKRPHRDPSPAGSTMERNGVNGVTRIVLPTQTIPKNWTLGPERSDEEVWTRATR